MSITIAIALILCQTAIPLILCQTADPPQAEAPPASESVKFPLAETIVAELLRGINHAPKRGGHASTKLPHSRIWTKAELKAKFGEPTEVSDNRNLWKWGRDDGTAIAEFQTKGYGNSKDVESLRLQIYSVHFEPIKK